MSGAVRCQVTDDCVYDPRCPKLQACVTLPGAPRYVINVVMGRARRARMAELRRTLDARRKAGKERYHHARLTTPTTMDGPREP